MSEASVLPEMKCWAVPAREEFQEAKVLVKVR